MSKKILVSVIMPTYNRARLLPFALQSVILQTYKNIEIIVVDDGSTDNTSDILRSYIKIDKRIKLIRNKRKQGLPQARNIGLAYSKGQMIFFTEDDLILHPKLLQILIETYYKLSRYIKIGAVAPRILLMSSERSYMKEELVCQTVGLIGKITGRIHANYGIEYNDARVAGHLPATSLIPRFIFNEIGVYDTVYKGTYLREESDLYLRMIKKGYKLVYQPKAISYHFAGYSGGCMKFSSSLKTQVWELINHSIFIIKYFKQKFLPMFVVNMIQKLLKIKYISKREYFEKYTIIDRIDFALSCNDFWKREIDTQARIRHIFSNSS